MMTKNQINERKQLEILTMEQLVPSNHLVRKLDVAIDFSFIYPIVETLYSTANCPFLTECTENKSHTKLIQPHIWADFRRSRTSSSSSGSEINLCKMQRED